MAGRLEGKRVAILVASSGVEEAELLTPRKALNDEGAATVLLAPESGSVQAFESDVNQAGTYDVDLVVADASATDFDALVLPGGTTNADSLRLDEQAVALVKAFVEAGKPVASICHGPWALVEAGVLEGKTLTSWPSLQTDIRNAGGTWVDVESFTCAANEWTLVTSRKPDDLPAFSAAAVEAFA
ncbi:MAG: type 1 glutamine amidotransferase [Nocardioidaceae bacterium]|nr:type 1 glutamine amidotransferase [Nocardioidaceae bacterium]